MFVIAVTGNVMSCVGVDPPITLPAIVITSFSSKLEPPATLTTEAILPLPSLVTVNVAPIPSN